MDIDKVHSQCQSAASCFLMFQVYIGAAGHEEAVADLFLGDIKGDAALE